MRALTIFFVSTALLAQAPAPQAPAPAAAATQDSSEIPAAKSIGTMSEFMLEVVYPTSNELFYVGREEQKTEKEALELSEIKDIAFPRIFNLITIELLVFTFSLVRKNLFICRCW